MLHCKYARMVSGSKYKKNCHGMPVVLLESFSVSCKNSGFINFFPPIVGRSALRRVTRNKLNFFHCIFSVIDNGYMLIAIM